MLDPPNLNGVLALVTTKALTFARYRPFAYSGYMPNISLKVDRVQWAVGNGGFHSEDVRILIANEERQKPILRLVYDCGTKWNKTALDNEIVEWVNRSGGVAFEPGDFNVLVISHFDADHVSGLQKLARTGFVPDLVVLPFLSDDERILQVIRTAAQGYQNTSNSDTEFVVNLVRNPVGTLHELWKDTVIVQGNPDTLDNGDRVDASEQLIDVPISDQDDYGLPRISLALDTSRSVRILMDDAGLQATAGNDAGTSGSHKILWECRWGEHRHPNQPIDHCLERFRYGLVALLYPSVSIGDLKSVDGTWNAISSIDGAAAAAKVYKMLLNKIDLNPFSMVLWTGPGHPKNDALNVEPFDTLMPRHWWRKSGWCGGWLGTGDAVLLSQKHVDELSRIIGCSIERTDVLNAPHHGSKNNSRSTLYERLPEFPGTVLMPASGRKGYNHPAPDVVKAALRSRHAVHCVDENLENRFEWRVTVEPTTQS